VIADFTRYRSAATYQQWASVVAAPIITDLVRAHRGDAGGAVVPDELARQQAVEALEIVDSEAEERFTRIAVLASQLLGVEQALILFVDHDRFWIKAASDPAWVTAPDFARSGSIADYALREPAPFIVEDASMDPRFANLESVRGEVALRFVAIYPIESAGVRIGVISALSREPRSWTESETKLLRDFALMVQRELQTD
jgi:GAF domain-containing protein